MGHIENAARRQSTKITRPRNSRIRRNQCGEIRQLWIQTQDDSLPIYDLLGHNLGDTSGRRRARRRRRVLENYVGPSLEDLVNDMHLPIDCVEKSDFVLVDLLSVKPRNLAPGPGRIVSILKIL
jgi:hypothetical protein